MAPAASSVNVISQYAASKCAINPTGRASRENHVRDLQDTSGSRSTGLNDGLGIVVVEEEVAGAHDLRPRFTNNLGTSRDRDGACHDVCTSREVQNLAPCIL